MKGLFCLTGLTGKVRWSDNWVTYIDSMFQSWIFVQDTRSLFVPTEIQKLTINPMQHIIYLQSLDVNAERGRF
jgi:fatty acid synthase